MEIEDVTFNYTQSNLTISHIAHGQRRSERNEDWRCSTVQTTEQAHTATKPHAYLFLSTAQAPNISINTSVYSTLQPQCSNEGRNRAGGSSLRPARSLQANSTVQCGPANTCRLLLLLLLLLLSSSSNFTHLSCSWKIFTYPGNY